MKENPITVNKKALKGSTDSTIQYFKLCSEVVMRDIVGDTVLVPVGAKSLEWKGLFTLNESGAFICEQLKEEKSEEELLKALLDTFDVNIEEAKYDLHSFITSAKKYNILEISQKNNNDIHTHLRRDE